MMQGLGQQQAWVALVVPLQRPEYQLIGSNSSSRDLVDVERMGLRYGVLWQEERAAEGNFVGPVSS